MSSRSFDSARRRAKLSLALVAFFAGGSAFFVPLPVLGQGGLSRGALFARWNALRGDPYELDAVERFLENGAEDLDCDREGLVSYSGTTLRYRGPVLVRPAFRERLERFERVVAELAEEIYGRKPRAIRHYGAFSCRTSRGRSHRLSEHALANAIDVIGFDFGPATKAEPLPAGLPKELRRSFRVRVEEHWSPRARPADEIHGRFLRELTERLRARRDIFRSLIGPSHWAHKDHFHFDVSPWRYVNL